MFPIKLRIITGGQTGIDRVALDAAIEVGLEHGGWCPKGRLAEDGVIPGKYKLTETSSRRYSVRTEKNVEESDGTLILFGEKIGGGTALTVRLAVKHCKPCLKLNFGGLFVEQFESELDQTQRWIKEHSIQTLNIAGPRKSSSPELSAQVYPFLIALFGSI